MVARHAVFTISRRVLRQFAAGILCGLLSACATMPGSGAGFVESLAPPQAVADVLARFTVPRSFREALSRGDWPAARQLYADNAPLLEKEAPTEVGQLARHVNSEWEPRLTSARTRLENVSAGEGQVASWNTAIREGRSTLQEYAGQRILAGRESAAHAALQQGVENTARLFATTAPQLFARYSHADLPLFFADLPVDIGTEARRATVAANVQALAAAIRAADPAKAKELTSEYGGVLSREQRKPLDDAYSERVARARFGRSENLSPLQWLVVSRAVAEAGGPARGMRAVKVEGGSNASVTIDGQSVDDTLPAARVGDAVRAATASGDRLLLLVDTHSAVIAELLDPRMASERKQVGTRSVPNPEYRNAQREVERLEEEHRKIAAQNAQIQRQTQELGRQGGVRGMAAFGAVLGNLAGGTGEVMSKRDLERAREALAGTPPTIQEPVFSEERVPVATREQQVLTQPTIYVVDTDKARFWKVGKSLTESERSTVPASAADRVAATAVRPSVALSLVELGSEIERATPLPAAQLPAAIDADRAAFRRLAARQEQEAQARTAQARRELAGLRGQQVAAAGPGVPQQSPGSRATGGGGSAGDSCHTSLAYLDSRLPNFRVPMLQDVRRQLVATDILDTMRKAKAQGYSAERAIDATLESARQMEGQMKVAGQCASEVDALGTTDEAFLQGIRNGQLASIASCDGIRNSCLCSGLTLRLGAVGMRAAAAAMQCHARAGRW